ncbi:hypothetical protein BDP67DRAFT_528950 [Colletotrichum lupini]|nr:hypothetical protein BDP67DRAFT_528950 [Colletotrichum lupini]
MWEEIVIRYHQLKKPRRSVDTNKPVGNDVLQAAPDSDSKVTIAASNPIVNLCEEIHKRHIQGGTGSYGEITDKTSEKPREYRVYPGKCLPGRDAWSAIALREVLEDPSKYSGLHGQYVAKRKLAASVSVGFLQANAVRCCIEEEFIREHLDLTDQDFRQEVYERVVRPIEDEHTAYM